MALLHRQTLLKAAKAGLAQAWAVLRLALWIVAAGAIALMAQDRITPANAPTDATYITQTANGSLSAEQALSGLSSGIMRVATTTGVITSLTDSAGIAANITDETGTGSLVFSASPTFTGQVNLADGSASAPTITWSSESSSGIYRVGGNLIGFPLLGVNYLAYTTGTLRLRNSSSFSWSTSDPTVEGSDLFLYRDAANALALRNVGNAQTFAIYNTFTDVSNYERLSIGWAANVLTITPQAAGTGTLRNMTLGVASSTVTFPGTITNNLSIFAATTSAQLAGVLSDETGTGVAVFGTSPTFTTTALFPNGSAGAPGVSFSADTDTGFFKSGDGALVVTANGVAEANFTESALQLRAAGIFGWTDGTPQAGSRDTGLKRNAAGVVEVNNGSAGVFRDLALRDLRPNNVLSIAGTAPTISSGFGTTPSVSANNGTIAFRINVGTGGTASSGVIGLPTATTGWNCNVDDITTPASYVTDQTASTTTTATVQNYSRTTGLATAWTASDILAVSCFAL